MTVLEFDLNIFISDPIVLLPGLQYLIILLILPSSTSLIKQVNWHPLVNHFGLICSIFIWNYTNIFVFELLNMEIFSYGTWALSCHFIEYRPKMITSRVVICHHLKLSTHKWKALNFITYSWSQVFCHIWFFFSTMFKKTTIAFPCSSGFHVSNVSSWSNDKTCQIWPSLSNISLFFSWGKL